MMKTKFTAIAMSLLAAPAMGQAEDASTLDTVYQGLRGVFAGSYYCEGSGMHGVTLAVTDVKSPPDFETAGEVSGVLSFYPLLAHPSGPRGAFEISGTLTPLGVLDMEPGAWIDQPENYGAAGIDGSVNLTAGADMITGRPSGAGADRTGCRALRLYKISMAAPD